MSSPAVAADAAPSVRRGLALAAAWVLPTYLVLPCVSWLPPVQLFSDATSYAGIHAVMEAFSCAVSILIFGIGWYAARADRSAHMAVLSTAFLATALLDFAHLLSYEGMPTFVTPAEAQKAIDFWLGARYAEAAGLLAFALLPPARRLGPWGLYALLAASLAYGALVAWAVLFHLPALPRTYVPGIGLTGFKVAVEYGVIALHVATLAVLLGRRTRRLDFPVPLLFAAALLLVASELALTLYSGLHDTYNFVGHLYKVAAYALIYRAVFVRGVTEPYRRRVASERLYRQLTEQAADAIFRLDRDGRILTANPCAARLTGRQAGELPGTALADLLAAEDGARLAQRLAARPAAGPAVLEAQVARRDAGLVPAEISIGPLDQGGWLAIARDLTERRRSEQAIRIRDIAFAACGIPIAIADLAGRLTYANRALAELWGLRDESEVVGLAADDFLADREEAARVIGAVTLSGQWTGELKGRRRDGRLIDLVLSASLVRGADGRPVCLIGSFRDITEQKAVTEQLHKSEELLRLAAAAAGIGVYDHDHASELVYWSPDERAIYGVDPDQEITIGLFLSRIHPEDRERVAAAVRQAHEPAGDGRFDIDYRIVRPDGTVRWLLTRGRTLFEGEGAARRAVRTVGAVFDTTDRVRAAEERAALELKLMQAQKMEAVGQLTGGIAHDFNNLLGVASGNLELLGERLPAEPEQRTLLERALAAIDRGATLTRSLLAFARRQPLSPVPLDANRLIAETAELFRRPLGERIDLVAVTAGGLWPCEADPTQLQAALLNLLVNARDAMPEGGKITLETANVRLDDEYAASHAEVSPGLYVLIAVTDTGRGMAPDVLKHAFEPFFTTKPVGAGSGLGLSMVYGFVKQSGGHVKIYSEVGKGTSIKLYLPRAAGAALDQAAARAPSPRRSRGETILLVEDDAELRATVATMLRESGFAVAEAASAEQALRSLAESGAPDLLLTDVILPGAMNGVELVRAASALHPGLATVYMSGYTENSIIHHGRLDPGVLLLQKPFRKVDLLAMVRRALGP